MRWFVTDDIYSETWRQLGEYSNHDFAIDAIIDKHGVPNSKSDRANINKQAEQARVCVLQAREYMDAARTASLFTRPNHCYYSAIALASLILLINGDGTKSLDYLRGDSRNSHHGLSFSTGCNASAAVKGVALAECSRVEILPHGHFANWYQVLPSVGAVSAVVENLHGSTTIKGVEQIGAYAVPSFSSLVGSKRTLLDLLRFLPDLNADLQRFSLAPVNSRTTHEVGRGQSGEVTYTWRIHGCSSDQALESLLAEFRLPPRFIDSVNFDGPAGAKSGIVRIRFNSPSEFGFHWPNSRDTLNHDTISYAEMVEMHEIVDLYLVSYQLSMLSRYFPDVWVKCIESQCRAAKLIDRATEVIIKKLPILVLSFLSGEETIISTHREPWKD